MIHHNAARATAFRAMHRPGNPVVLYNIWDAGSAAALRDAGATALATGSWPMAAAQGYPDGQQMPFKAVLTAVARITATVDLPVTVDFEGGHATEPNDIAANLIRLVDVGAIGVNFEDQVIGGTGLYDIDMQARRITAIRAAATAQGLPLVINARTDMFLKAASASDHAALLHQALARATAFAKAGADSIFVPGLSDLVLIGAFCANSPLPVNVLATDPHAPLQPLHDAGVGRISFGPHPYRRMMKALQADFLALNQPTKS